MAVIKVQASIFSSIRSVGRALEKMTVGDEIQVLKGTYKESITFLKDAIISGSSKKDTIIEGAIVIPKDTAVIIKNLTIKPSSQLLIEGEATFIDVNFNGKNVNSILYVKNGKLKITNCSVCNSNDLGIAAMNKSQIEIKETVFSNNGKSHIFAEHSTVRVSNCHFERAQHAIWIKKHSNVKSGTNTFKYHEGTQVIVQNYSLFQDNSSTIINGNGNGVFATRNCQVQLSNTIIKNHHLPQIWIQKNSSLTGINCHIENGKESALMVRDNSEGSLQHCYVSNHVIANIQVAIESRLHVGNSQILDSSGIGVQIKEKSIANFDQCTFTNSKLSQLFISDESIVSIKECTVQKGLQIGLFVENDSNCTIVQSSFSQHPNTAITICDAELTIIESKIMHNAGNGILAFQNATIHADDCEFKENNMPHIAGKEQTALTVINSLFEGGKSIYLLEQSHAHITASSFTNGDGVQIEITDETKLTLNNCRIDHGKSNAVKASMNSTLNIYDSQIANHRLPQVVINDSSLIFNNSELIDGERNGFIIENYSEAFIQDSFITKHQYPQIWIDKHSTVEMKTTTMTEGKESDIYVQNYSNLYVDQCIIRNDYFKFNVQAVNNSKINLTHTVVDNKLGDQFYIENNSFITHKLEKDSTE